MKHTPASAARRLGVSTQTIRRWTDQFADHLSDGASGRPRALSDADLYILETARSWLASGLPVDQVRAQLGAVSLPADVLDLVTVEDADHAPASIVDTAAMGALVGTLERIDRSLATMADQSGELGELRRRVAALEDAGRDPGHDAGLGGGWPAWALVLLGLTVGILAMIVLWIALVI